MDRKLIGKKDILLIAVLVIAALIIYILINYFSSLNGDVYAQIWVDNSLVKEVSLDRDNTFTIPEVPNMEFCISGGKIAVAHSDCPDKICVNTGFINKAGQTAVCLPNKTSVRIVSRGKNQPDAVV